MLLDNYSSGLIDGLGWSLVKLLLGERVELMPLAREAEVDPKALDDFVGNYALSPLYFLKVEREGDHLTAAATAQPALPLYPQSESTFFYKAIRATVTFERNAGGKVVAITFEQGGSKSRGPRIK